jgi:hypothetical protein
MHLLHLIPFIISFMLMLAPANACQCLIKGTRTNNADGTRACCKGRLVNSGDNVVSSVHVRTLCEQLLTSYLNI